MILNQAEDIKLGNIQVDRVYHGTEIVWPPVTPDPYVPIADVDLSSTQILIKDSLGGWLPYGSRNNIKLEMAMTTTTRAEQIFGVLTGSAQQMIMLFDSSLHMEILRSGNATTSDGTQSPSVEGIYTIQYGENACSFSGPNNISVTSGGYVAAYNNCSIWLFGFGNRYFNGKCAYVKVWINDVLQAQLEPRRRVEDNKVGLYDTINDIFYETTVGA